MQTKPLTHLAIAIKHLPLLILLQDYNKNLFISTHLHLPLVEDMSGRTATVSVLIFFMFSFTKTKRVPIDQNQDGKCAISTSPYCA